MMAYHYAPVQVFELKLKLKPNLMIYCIIWNILYKWSCEIWIQPDISNWSEAAKTGINKNGIEQICMYSLLTGTDIPL